MKAAKTKYILLCSLVLVAICKSTWHQFLSFSFIFSGWSLGDGWLKGRKTLMTHLNFPPPNSAENTVAHNCQSCAVWFISPEVRSTSLPPCWYPSLSDLSFVSCDGEEAAVDLCSDRLLHPSVLHNVSKDYAVFGKIMTRIRLTRYEHLIEGDAEALRSTDKPAEGRTGQ